MHILGQLQWLQVKCAQSDQIKILPNTMQRVWTSYYYFYWNAYCRSQLKFLTQSYIVWANYNYFYWNEHDLSQLQLFKLESAYSEPIANISKKTCTNWASCIYFKPIMHIFYAKCNYSNWKTHGLSQLQWFQVKCV